MEHGKLAWKNPKELHSNTSVLTLVLYVFYGLTVHLGLPSFLWYLIAILLVANLIVIGKLFYEIEQNRREINVTRNRVFAIFRTLINLVLFLLVGYHAGWI